MGWEIRYCVALRLVMLFNFCDKLLKVPWIKRMHCSFNLFCCSHQCVTAVTQYEMNWMHLQATEVRCEYVNWQVFKILSLSPFCYWTYAAKICTLFHNHEVLGWNLRLKSLLTSGKNIVNLSHGNASFHIPCSSSSTWTVLLHFMLCEQ